MRVTRAGGWVAGMLALAGPLGAQQDRGFIPEEYSCIMCHTDMREAFVRGVHSEQGIACVNCHGGNPDAFDQEGAHSGDYGGPLTKPEAVELCVSCHGDVVQMRQFGLRPVTIEELGFSEHGRRVMAGDTAAPSCGDCHGSHGIYAKEDVRSLINPTQIAFSCSRCHDDRRRFPADGDTHHLNDWARSGHGRAILVDHNYEAATCASCHGSHGALPPGIGEVANVCGACHRSVRDAYLQGSHGDVARGGSGSVPCTACHDNHDTEVPEPEVVAGLCTGCHAESSAPVTVGLELQEQLLAAEHWEERARESIREIVGAGRPTYDEEIRLLTLATHVREIGVAAHTLDVEVVDDLGRRIESLATEIGARAEIVAETRWERKLILIPLWLGILFIVALSVRKRRRLREGDTVVKNLEDQS